MEPLGRQSGGEEWVPTTLAGGAWGWASKLGGLGCSLPPFSAHGRPSAQAFQGPFELTAWSGLAAGFPSTSPRVLQLTALGRPTEAALRGGPNSVTPHPAAMARLPSAQGPMAHSRGPHGARQISRRPQRQPRCVLDVPALPGHVGALQTRLCPFSIVQLGRGTCPFSTSTQLATRAKGCELSSAGLLGSQLESLLATPNPSGRMSAPPPFTLPTACTAPGRAVPAGGARAASRGAAGLHCGSWVGALRAGAWTRTTAGARPQAQRPRGWTLDPRGSPYGGSGHRHG